MTTPEDQPTAEDSIRIALDELGREAVATDLPEEHSAFIPVRRPNVRQAVQADREIARNRFPCE